MTGVAQTPAVVVGAGINGLGVVRSLGAQGVPVHVLDSDPKAPAMRSRYASAHRIPAIGVETSLLSALRALPQRVRDSRPVLILTTEDAVIDAANDYSALAQRYRLTMAEPAALAPALNKDSMRDIAVRAGLQVPPTAHITKWADMQSLEAWPLPWIIKPARRHAGYSERFDKAYLVDDKDRAMTLIRAMLEVTTDLIVQQWIVGADSDLYFCLQYRPRSGGRSAAFVGRKLRSWPPRVGGTASCTRAEDTGALIESTDAFFAEAGIWGLASMEYKRDERTGQYVVVEPTVGRTDFQEEVATLHGVNLPFAAYCDALGIPDIGAATNGDRRVVWREHMSDTRSSSAQSAREAYWPTDAVTVDALHRWRDPWPATAALVDRARQRMRRDGASESSSS